MTAIETGKRVRKAETELVCADEPLTASDTEYTVHQAAARTGLSEHTLRYYERAGLLQPIKRQDSSRHRRYSSMDLARISTLACLRAAGMSLDQMRRYFELAEKGKGAAAALRELLETQRRILGERLAQMRWHQDYVERKIGYWAAIESGDTQGAGKIAHDLTTMMARRVP